MRDAGGGRGPAANDSRMDRITRIGGEAVRELGEAIGARVATGQPIRWSPMFEIGITEIDTEHAGLFGDLNALSHQVVVLNERGIGTKQALGTLNLSLDRHFAQEEKLFDSVAPRLVKAHAEGHRHFSEGLLRIGPILLGEDRSAARAALATLATLLVQHILVDDKEFVGAVRGARA